MVPPYSQMDLGCPDAKVFSMRLSEAAFGIFACSGISIKPGKAIDLIMLCAF